MKKHNKPIFVGIIIFIILILTFLVWFLFEILNEKDPQFFPFNDQSATYTVLKDDLNLIKIRYEGKNNWVSTENYFDVLVGNSQIDLNKFIGKKIMPLEGEFKSTSHQCILGICKKIGGPHIAINLYKLELIDETNSNEK